MNTLMRLAVAAVVALALAGCGEKDPVQLSPEARWTPVPGAGVVIEGDRSSATLDFGTVRLGSEVTASVDVTNAGSAAMTVMPPGVDAPFAADVPAEGLLVNVGETRRVTITFAPDEEDTYRWDGSLTIGEDAQQSFSLALRGVGDAPAFVCDTDWLDFGSVVKGRRKSLTVNCRNASAVEGVLVFESLTGEDPGQFTHRFTGDGREEVAPGATLAIEITYQASAPGGASAVLPIESEVNEIQESVVRLRLTGTALDHAVSCSPASIDFGFVAPGATGHGTLRCRNLGSDPFRLESAEPDISSDEGFAAAGTFPMEIPPASGTDPGELEIDVLFTPQATDTSRRLNGLLVVTTDDPGTPRIDVRLTGFAGGPVIACTPAAIDFGMVPTGMPASRAFVCTNAGTDDPNRLDDALLVSAIESSNPVEFRAEVRGGLDPAGYPVGGTFIVDVTYDPVDEGLDAGGIALPSNAVNATPDASYRVSVSGFGRDLPPCELAIVPPRLKFGIVDKGRTATLEFELQNQLVDAECLIQNVRLADDCDLAFSLPAGETPIAVLPAAGKLRFPVSFSPNEYRDELYTCDVLFDVSDPDDPHRVVPVTGASQIPCALIAPNDLDFGRVEPHCATRDRVFEIINMCSTPLTIESVELAEAASDEFFIRSYPAEGTVVEPGLGVQFHMAYRPEDLGVDLGAVYVQVSGSLEPYSAMLRGEGALGAMQHETFEQNDRPKVDVLWVIDNSGSMGWVHDELAANLGPFLSFADAQSIDYHIAATTSGLAPASGSGCLGGVGGGEDGRFFPVDHSWPRILTPESPNLEENWAAIVTPGTCGGTGQHTEMIFEAAYRALHTPVIDNCDDPRHPEGNDGNCGFLRPEAHLSIIGVTDEMEQSPRNVNFYYNAFQSLKGFRNRHLFNYHSIAGPEHVGCSNAQACNACEELVRKTEGGVFQSICAPDWNAALRDMSAAAFGFKTCFGLSSEPADQNANGYISDREGEIEVRMNGRVVPSRGDQGQRIWSYDASGNALCFDPLAVPEPGTQIEANYKVSCITW